MAELSVSLTQFEGVNAVDNSIFGQHKRKYLFRTCELLLHVLYTLVIYSHIKYWFSFLALLCGVGVVMASSKAWNLYAEYWELRRFEVTVNETYSRLNTPS